MWLRSRALPEPLPYVSLLAAWLADSMQARTTHVTFRWILHCSLVLSCGWACGPRVGMRARPSKQASGGFGWLTRSLTPLLALSQARSHARSLMRSPVGSLVHWRLAGWLGLPGWLGWLGHMILAKPSSPEAPEHPSPRAPKPQAPRAPCQRGGQPERQRGGGVRELPGPRLDDPALVAGQAVDRAGRRGLIAALDLCERSVRGAARASLPVPPQKPREAWWTRWPVHP